ncbi:MAG: hypothetical protein ACYDC6_12445 [Acidobacteriaceae bacterium]
MNRLQPQKEGERIIDEFPAMPTRRCPDCDAPKKVMFFARTGVYCREHKKKRNQETDSGRHGAIDPGYGFNVLPIGKGRAAHETQPR